MLFVAGNTNKALCSTATLGVLDALDAITTMPKAKTKGSKKCDGGSKGNLNGTEIRKRNHAFRNESIRVREPFIISSCTVYIS